MNGVSSTEKVGNMIGEIQAIQQAGLVGDLLNTRIVVK
jgi:hypothetical protein